MLMLSAAHFSIPFWHIAVDFVVMSSRNRDKDARKIVLNA